MKDHNPSPLTRQATGVAGNHQHQTQEHAMSNDHEFSAGDLTPLFYAQQRLDAGQSSDPAGDQALMDAYYDGGFHWTNATFFKRMPDASVRLRTFRPLTSDFASHWTWDDRTIDPLSWASIVCSVSAGGETGERWEAAQDFHGRALSHQPPRAPDEPGDRAREAGKFRSIPDGDA